MPGFAIVRADDVDNPYDGTDVPGEFRSLTDALGAEQVAVTLIRVPPHSDMEQSTGHTHSEIEELYIVAKGTITFRCDDHVEKVTAPGGSPRVPGHARARTATRATSRSRSGPSRSPATTTRRRSTTSGTRPRRRSRLAERGRSAADRRCAGALRQSLGGVLGVSSRSWLAVTAMRRPGREGFVSNSTGSSRFRPELHDFRRRFCQHPQMLMGRKPDI